MRKFQLLLTAFLACSSVLQAAEQTLSVKLANPLGEAREAVPVVVPLGVAGGITLNDVRSAVVTIAGQEIPCQLDDMDDDGVFDELAFVVDMQKKQKVTAQVVLSDSGEPRQYKARTYACLNIRDRKEKNPKHIPMLSLTVPAESNPYQYVFPHGPLLESELVGFRIYADHRQSVDYYGHRNKQVELPETKFYPTKEQKSTTYGDDVLYTGSTYGCGTLHGWNGKTSVMFENVRSRTYTLLTTGPVRSIIETVNKAWRVTPDAKPVDIRTRYILYAGHRDVLMDVKFSRPVADLQLSTGVTDIVGSEKLSDGAGLLGCWGTALAGNNPAVYDVHTVGLAVCVPKEYFKSESRFSDGKEVNPNQAYVAVVGTKTDSIHYWFSATCDMETFGFADSKAWMEHLKAWKKQLSAPVKIEIGK